MRDKIELRNIVGNLMETFIQTHRIDSHDGQHNLDASLHCPPAISSIVEPANETTRSTPSIAT